MVSTINASMSEQGVVQHIQSYSKALENAVEESAKSWSRSRSNSCRSPG
jgi:hypothetical protein